MALGNFIRNIGNRIKTSVRDFQEAVKTSPASLGSETEPNVSSRSGRFNIRDSLKSLGSIVGLGQATRRTRNNVEWTKQLTKAPTALANFTINAKQRYLFNVDIVGGGSGERSTIRLSLTKEQAAQFVDRPEYYINEVTDYRERYKEPYFEVAGFWQ